MTKLATIALVLLTSLMLAGCGDDRKAKDPPSTGRTALPDPNPRTAAAGGIASEG
jgi:hypothetical protein